MKSRFSLLAPAALAVLLVAACSGSPSIPSIGIPGLPGAGSTPAPGQTAVAGHACDGYPTFNVAASPQPTMPVDSALLETFPEQVAGQPVSDKEAAPFLGLMCYLAGEVAVDQMGQSTSVLGINIATMSFGSFSATVGDNSIKVSAIRTPGQDAGALIGNTGLFGGFLGLSLPGTTGLSDANVGGKNVKVVTDTDGTKSYYYAHADTLWTFENASDAEAQAILSALP